MGRLAGLLCLFLVLTSAAAFAQDQIKRPSFYRALGLLETRSEAVSSAIFPAEVRFDITTGPGVETRVAEPSLDRLFAMDFQTEDGDLIESLVLTTGTVDPGPRETRLFILANLQVLRLTAQVQARHQNMRVHSFAVADFGTMPAVQTIGQYTDPQHGEILFRTVGYLPFDTEEVLFAITRIKMSAISVTDVAALRDTYTFGILDTLATGPRFDEN